MSGSRFPLLVLHTHTRIQGGPLEDHPLLSSLSSSAWLMPVGFSRTFLELPPLFPAGWLADVLTGLWFVVPSAEYVVGGGGKSLILK